MADNMTPPTIPTAAQAEAGHRQRKAPDGTGAYYHATNGAPCPTWNRDPNSCTKARRDDAQSTGAQRMAHLCGYCANVRRIVAAHSEPVCYSKKSRDKGSASRNQEADFLVVGWPPLLAPHPQQLLIHTPLISAMAAGKKHYHM